MSSQIIRQVAWIEQETEGARRAVEMIRASNQQMIDATEGCAQIPDGADLNALSLATLRYSRVLSALADEYRRSSNIIWGTSAAPANVEELDDE